MDQQRALVPGTSIMTRHSTHKSSPSDIATLMPTQLDRGRSTWGGREHQLVGVNNDDYKNAHGRVDLPEKRGVQAESVKRIISRDDRELPCVDGCSFASSCSFAGKRKAVFAGTD